MKMNDEDITALSLKYQCRKTCIGKIFVDNGQAVVILDENNNVINEEEFRRKVRDYMKTKIINEIAGLPVRESSV